MAKIGIRSKLLSRRDVAERTIAFQFEKPQGFQFIPGQALEIKLIDPKQTDAEGNGRAFSIASAPSDDRLEIATRFRNSAFKRTLNSMPVGSFVELDGPFGSMTLHKAAAKPAVIIAGGIGVTPFRSILRQAAADHAARPFVLLTSNRRPEDAPYHEELQQLGERLSDFRFIPTMTEPEKSGRSWSGHRGLITGDWIAKIVPEIRASICYTAGPPEMVAAMRKAFLEAGADEDSIRTEDFEGY